MNCSNCNAPLPSDAAFCSNCGTRVQASPSADAGMSAGVRTVSNLGTMVPTELLDRPAAQVLAPGALFADRYVVERQLGAGGMGVVYVAKDRNTSEDVALKLLHPGLLSGPNAMKRLVAEGVTARQIRHPNIVAVYDIAQAGGQPFLTMEYVKGGSLRNWLKSAMRSSQEVPVATAIGIVKAILAGLAEAHRMNVVHRDLKPENVLLMGEPFQGDYRLKILDFGIAKAMSATGPVTTTSAGALGTPLYMAPEQRTAPDTVGPSADLYSVSVMLYELLMENPPQGLWEPPSKSRNNVPPALDAVIERGLKTRARDRFQSADDYAAALDAAEKAPLGPARPGSGVDTAGLTNAWNSVLRLGKELGKSVADKAQAAQQAAKSTQMSDAEWKEQWKKLQAEKAQQDVLAGATPKPPEPARPEPAVDKPTVTAAATPTEALPPPPLPAPASSLAMPEPLVDVPEVTAAATPTEALPPLPVPAAAPPTVAPPVKSQKSPSRKKLDAWLIWGGSAVAAVAFIGTIAVQTQSQLLASGVYSDGNYQYQFRRDGTNFTLSGNTRTVGYLRASGQMSIFDCSLQYSLPERGINNQPGKCQVLDAYHLRIDFYNNGNNWGSLCLHSSAPHSDNPC